jgi:hypothetical protein
MNDHKCVYQAKKVRDHAYVYQAKKVREHAYVLKEYKFFLSFYDLFIL